MWLRCAGILLGLLLMLPVTAHAAFFIDLSAFMLTDTLATTGSSAVSSKSSYQATLGAGVNRTGKITIGWDILSLSTSDQTTAGTDVFSTLDMGPVFGYFFDKEHTWNLSLAYHLLANATYQLAGATAEKWKGTSLSGHFGFTPMISETVSIGVLLNYYSGSFTEKVVNNTTYTQESNVRTLMYPSIYIGMRF